MAEHKNYEQSGVGSSLELGKTGPRIKDSGGAIEARNTGDTAYAKFRAAHPVDLNDVVTLQYLKSRGDVRVTGQIDGSAPPAAGSAGTVYLCTTAGGTYVLNHLYLDDGAIWNDVGPVEGLSITVSDDLTGGTVEFEGDHTYLWDADGSTWVNIGPSGTSLAGTQQYRAVALAFGSSSPLSIGGLVPLGGIVTGVRVNVTQAFNGTAPTLTLGDVGDADRFLTAAGVNLKATGLYVAENAHEYGAATQATATYVADGSSAGAALIVLEFMNP